MRHRIPKSGLPQVARSTWGSIFTRTKLGFTIPRNRCDANDFQEQSFPGHSGPLVIDPRELVSVIGVGFKPGGAFTLLGIRASERADAHVDLEELGERQP